MLSLEDSPARRFVGFSGSGTAYKGPVNTIVL